MSETSNDQEPLSGGSDQRLVRRREDFDRSTIAGAIEEALTAIGKAKTKLPLNLAHELQSAHDHLLNARDWVRLYTPNDKLSDCP